MNPHEQFRQFIRQRGLKATHQRDVIVDTFFKITSHISVDELYAEIRKREPSIGFATVYRTLKLLKESGLAREWNFGDGHARYEHVRDINEHHDHLICVQCGAIEEFEEDRIEQLQEEVAAQYGFTLTHHTMELYGYCAKCDAARKQEPPGVRVTKPVG